MKEKSRNFVVGDIQGHFFKFLELMEKIRFNPKIDHMYFLGDIINRGPKSELMLDWAYENQHCSSLILGNHEEHLINCYTHGRQYLKEFDTLEIILEHPKLEKWIDFLKNTPYVRWVVEDQKKLNFFLVHAGINPLLTLKENYELGKNLTWNENPKQGAKKYFIYLRYVDKDGNFSSTEYKGPVLKHSNKMPPNCYLWTEFVKEDLKETFLFFGHFAALGLYKHPDKNIFCLDSGLVWGNELSCYCIEEKKIYQISS